MIVVLKPQTRISTIIQSFLHSHIQQVCSPSGILVESQDFRLLLWQYLHAMYLFGLYWRARLSAAACYCFLLQALSEFRPRFQCQRPNLIVGEDCCAVYRIPARHGHAYDWLSCKKWYPIQNSVRLIVISNRNVHQQLSGRPGKKKVREFIYSWNEDSKC